MNNSTDTKTAYQETYRRSATTSYPFGMVMAGRNKLGQTYLEEFNSTGSEWPAYGGATTSAQWPTFARMFAACYNIGDGAQETVPVKAGVTNTLKLTTWSNVIDILKIEVIDPDNFTVLASHNKTLGGSSLIELHFVPLGAEVIIRVTMLDPGAASYPQYFWISRAEVTHEASGQMADNYRYGFNGMEREDEMKGDGNSYDFGARIYDPRLGRWLSSDYHRALYPATAPYAFALNSPLVFKDINGNDVYYFDENMNLVGVIRLEGEDMAYQMTLSLLNHFDVLEITDLQNSIITDFDCLVFGFVGGYAKHVGASGGFEMVLFTKGPEAFNANLYGTVLAHAGYSMGGLTFYAGTLDRVDGDYDQMHRESYEGNSWGITALNENFVYTTESWNPFGKQIYAGMMFGTNIYNATLNAGYTKHIEGGKQIDLKTNKEAQKKIEDYNTKKPGKGKSENKAPAPKRDTTYEVDKPKNQTIER